MLGPPPPKYILAAVSGFRVLGRTDAPGHACPQRALHPYTLASMYFCPLSFHSVKLKLYREILNVTSGAVQGRSPTTSLGILDPQPGQRSAEHGEDRASLQLRPFSSVPNLIVFVRRCASETYPASTPTSRLAMIKAARPETASPFRLRCLGFPFPGFPLGTTTGAFGMMADPE